MTAGAQYDLYAWVRGELDADDSNGSWIVRAYYYDSNNAAISYQDAASGAAGSLTAAPGSSKASASPPRPTRPRCVSS